MMKLILLAPLWALVLVQPRPVYALDCAKASSPVDKLVCATPELRKADEAMGAAYFKLLRETSDPEFHEALIESQRRWLKTRSFGAERFGHAEDDKTDDRDVLLKMTRDRLTFLRNAEPIRVLEQERKIISKDTGGALAGFKTSCVLQPPPCGNWSYECWGGARRQHKDRVCSSDMEWASGHMTEYRLFGILKDGEPKLMATCSIGDLSNATASCPDPDGDEKANAAPHWDTNSTPSDNARISKVDNLWKWRP